MELVIRLEIRRRWKANQRGGQSVAGRVGAYAGGGTTTSWRTKAMG